MDTCHFDSKFKMVKQIGQGKFSKVFHCRNKNTQENVAIKIINKQFLSQADRLLVNEEIQTFERVKHYNILEMKESFETQSHIFIVMDLVQDGSLANLDYDSLTGN